MFPGTLNGAEKTSAIADPFTNMFILSVEITPPTAFGFSKKTAAFNFIVSEAKLTIFTLSTLIKTGSF